METIENDYCSFEFSKWLKEKKFDVECSTYFKCDYPIAVYQTSKYPIDIGDIRRPEHWQAIKWFRIKHDIHVIYDVGINGYYGLIKAKHKNSSVYYNKWVNEQENPFDSPEEAINAAFDYIKEKELI